MAASSTWLLTLILLIKHCISEFNIVLQIGQSTDLVRSVFTDRNYATVITHLSNAGTFKVLRYNFLTNTTTTLNSNLASTITGHTEPKLYNNATVAIALVTDATSCSVYTGNFTARGISWPIGGAGFRAAMGTSVAFSV